MYKFELTKIDPLACSMEELDVEISRLNSLREQYNNLQNAVKIYINSIYGAMGSPWFECYNMAIAEAVTLQGQDMIKFSNEIMDDYFLNHWHEDKELHKLMGLTYVNKLFDKTVCVYNDTDSCYITFGPMLSSCDWKGDPIEFILKLNELKLNKYINEKLNEYGKRFNTTNIQNLEFEKISYSGLLVAKKKYILDIAWKDPGVRYKPQERITPVGVEIVQGSTAKFTRRVLKELLNLLFQKGKNLQYAEIVRKLKDYKKEFVLQDPNDISKSVSIGDYEKYVLEDKREVRLGEKCPINVRAAATYNYTVLNSKWRTKYNLLKTGDKLKHYYCKGENGNEVFGFLPSNFPYEFAPEMDYDKQFEKVVVEPFNRFMESAGFNSIPGNLIYSKPLF